MTSVFVVREQDEFGDDSVLGVYATLEEAKAAHQGQLIQEFEMVGLQLDQRWERLREHLRSLRDDPLAPDIIEGNREVLAMMAAIDRGEDPKEIL